MPHAVASRCSTGPLGRQLTDTMVDHSSLPPFAPLGQVGMARVDRAARVAKGQRGAAIDVPAHCCDRPWPPAVLRIVARRFAQCTRGASRGPTGPLDRHLTDATVEAPFPAPFAPLGR
jgi:hypothetical protein